MAATLALPVAYPALKAAAAPFASTRYSPMKRLCFADKTGVSDMLGFNHLKGVLNVFIELLKPN